MVNYNSQTILTIGHYVQLQILQYQFSLRLITYPKPSMINGLAYGHGLFESMLLNDSALPLVDRHLARLSKGADTLSIPLDSSMVKQCIDLFIEQLNAASVTEGVLRSL